MDKLLNFLMMLSSMGPSILQSTYRMVGYFQTAFIFGYFDQSLFENKFPLSVFYHYALDNCFHAALLQGD